MADNVTLLTDTAEYTFPRCEVSDWMDSAPCGDKFAATVTVVSEKYGKHTINACMACINSKGNHV